MIEIFDQARVSKAKRAFTTRRVPVQDMRALETGPVAPVAGDLVLARVEAVGRLQRVELTTGRKAAIFPGDEIVVVYGNRYAPDAYEAEVPDDLSDCDLAAGGGIASLVLNSNAVWESKGSPTRLRPIGLVTDFEGRPINLARYALPMRPLLNRQVPVIAVCGATMNSGKTTTVAGMVRGLTQKGMKVGAAKITGTGSTLRTPAWGRLILQMSSMLSEARKPSWPSSSHAVATRSSWRLLTVFISVRHMPFLPMPGCRPWPIAGFMRPIARPRPPWAIRSCQPADCRLQPSPDS